MRVCQKKNWSLDDWRNLSEEAQEQEIAWCEYQDERLSQSLDMMQKALPRNEKGELVNLETYVAVLLARLELL